MSLREEMLDDLAEHYAGWIKYYIDDPGKFVDDFIAKVRQYDAAEYPGNIMTVDQWAAEQCGVEVQHIGKGLWYGDILKGYVWTIEDPRCREIVREHFQITTWWDEVGAWNATRSYFANVDIPDYQGGTIAEAEIACITAIYEAQVNV